MTARTTKPQTVPVRQTRPGTFKPGEHASAAARRSHQRRATAPAPQPPPQQPPQSAPQTPPQPGVPIREHIGVPPADFGAAARTAALAGVAAVCPPAATIRLQRTSPTWAAGYLCKLSPGTLSPWHGDLEEYIRETWGGGLYSVTVQDGETLAWQSNDIRIAGPVRYEGADVQPGQQAATAPLSPPPVPMVDSGLGQLAAAIDRINDRLDALAAPPTSPADPPYPPPKAQGPQGEGGLAGAIETWAEQQSRIAAVLRRLSRAENPPPKPQPEKNDDDDDDEPDKPEGARAVADRWLYEALCRVFDPRKGQGVAHGPPPGAVTGAPAGAAPAAGVAAPGIRIT